MLENLDCSPAAVHHSALDCLPLTVCSPVTLALPAGVLEEVCRDGLAELAKRQPGGALADPGLLARLLGLWDGICHLFAGRAKPSSWTSLLLKCAKLFTPEARAAAAEAAAAAGHASSGPMQRVSPAMWRDLKPLAALQQQLEAADVAAGGGAGGADEGGRAAKRRRG